MSGFVWKVVYKIQYDATTMDDTIAGKSINQSFISKLCMQFSIMATTDSPPPHPFWHLLGGHNLAESSFTT